MVAKQALAGIKITDFSWIQVAPLVTKAFAHHGATVVKIESSTKLDMQRTLPPMAGGVEGINRSGSFASPNDNKYSIALDLKHPRGLEIAKRLVDWADVVVENFMPGAIGAMGLGYEELRKTKEDIIMLSMSMFGQTGRYARKPGFGTQLTSTVGFAELVGWPDRDPITLPTALPDQVAPWYGVCAVLGALDYRERTGKGSYIDISLYETGISFLAQAMLDYSVNERVWNRNGNHCSYAAPHGVYPCQGDNRWCTIAVFNEGEWEALCEVMGAPEWTKLDTFATFLARKDNERELDSLVGGWTVNYTPEEVMRRCQEAGIAAGVVESNKDLFDDPQLRDRRHFWMLEHPEMGVVPYDGPSFRLSRTPAEPGMPSPCLGEHNEFVCTQILDMPDEEFIELDKAGVFK
jgi:benzylsuccinate CoA-transferase BbsF subunit